MTPTRRTYPLLIAILVALLLVSLALALWAWTLTGPDGTLLALPTPDAMAASRATATSRATPIPTLPGVNDTLLVCQRQAGLALNARQLVGAANLAADRELRLRWISFEGQINNLQDALPGVLPALEAALDVWEQGCTLYDRVQIEVYDRRMVAGTERMEERQVHRLTVHAEMADLLQWRANTIEENELVDRLDVTRAGTD